MSDRVPDVTMCRLLTAFVGLAACHTAKVCMSSPHVDYQLIVVSGFCRSIAAKIVNGSACMYGLEYTPPLGGGGGGGSSGAQVGSRMVDNVGRAQHAVAVSPGQ